MTLIVWERVMGIIDNLPVILASSTALLAGLYGYFNSLPNIRVYQNMSLFLVVFYIIGALIKRTVKTIWEERQEKLELSMQSGLLEGMSDVIELTAEGGAGIADGVDSAGIEEDSAGVEGSAGVADSAGGAGGASGAGSTGNAGSAGVEAADANVGVAEANNGAAKANNGAANGAADANVGATTANQYDGDFNETNAASNNIDKAERRVANAAGDV